MEYKKIIESVLRNLINFEIKSLVLDYLTEPGENYGSIILKINIEGVEDGEDKKLDLVAKLCPNNELLRKAFLTDVTFKKEVFAYKKAIVKIKQFQLDHNTFDDYFPKCYGTNLSISNGIIGDESIILLENLKVKQYKIGDRLVGFDLNHATVILKKLAHLHATIIALRVMDNESFEESIRPSLIPTNVGSTMMKGFSETALHFAKNINELQPYITKLEELVEKRNKMGGLQFPIETNQDFYTMLHTDLWTNNIMFKQHEEKKIKVKFIDLQLLEFGSLARDLLLFLFTSIQMNVIDKYLDYLLNAYYYNFQRSLSNFSKNFMNQKYSKEAFHKEINAVAPHELFHIIFMLKPIFSERGSIKNLDSICEADFGRIDNIGENYINRLRFVVLTFAKNKWI